MKPIPALLLIAALCACSGRTSPIMINDDDRRPAKADPDDRFAAPQDTDAAELKAAAAIKAIERRVQAGDLPKIQFEFDKDEITPESNPTLDLIAQVLLSDEHLKLMIFAHCDSIGSDEYNLDLSQRRAKSVKTALAQRGVYPPSMRFRGYGASKPIADNATDEGRAKNRRVEFYIMTREWKAVY
jgi:outer membrane protein OmpA-like peptidoglycan-associated protein